MNPGDPAKIQEIFQSAVELAPEERRGFLNESCRDNPELRAEVESLLAAHEEAGAFIEDSASDMAAALLDQKRQQLTQIGEYKIEKLLGAGGMGEVFLARDQRLNRHVALKLLSIHLTANEERVRRFRQEALAASGLNHPNILTIYEIEEHGPRPYIATEFVEGVTLRTHMSGNGRSLMDVLDITLQIAAALSVAHTAGIVHRDIKPENIMIRPDGLVKILDFGIAKYTGSKELRDENDQWLKTAEGAVMGTTAYMSPEQARGLPVDSRTDIWALGVMMYEMVAMRLPFTGATPSDRLAAIIEHEPEPIRKYQHNVPDSFERIVQRALVKDREGRYQQAADLVTDLRRTQTALGSTHQRGTSLPALVHRVPKLSKRQAAVSLLIAALMIGVLGYLIFRQRSSRAVETIDSLAILPFSNGGESADIEYLSDGITDSLINSLSRIPSLKVMSRNSVFHYKDRQVDAQTIGSILHVRGVMTGRVVQRGDDVTVTIELSDAQDNRHLWGEQYNRKLKDLLGLQSEIARDVSQKLQARLSGADQQKVANNYTNNPDAYELYLRGRYHLNKLTPPEVQTSVHYFQQAVAADASYALAHVGLSDAYSALALSVDMPATVFYPRAKAAAQRALEIEETLAEAHTSLGVALLFHDWNFVAAENQYQRALELNPNSAETHFSYAGLLVVLGKYVEGLEEIKRARELDPLSLRTNALEGRFLVLAGRTDEGLARLRNTIELEPNYFLAHLFAANAYAEKGMYNEAIATATKARDLSGGNAEAVATIGYALGASGQRREAQSILDELTKRSAKRYVPPYDFALIYNGMGELNETLAWLERGVEERDPKMLFLKGGSQWKNLRGSERFEKLLRRIGF
jgi:serine/threonine-protein kinase